MTNIEWAKCVLVLRGAYANTFRLDADGLVVWFDQLHDLPGDQVLAAIQHMIKTKTAFPSIADIRRLAEPPAPDPASAWVKACKWVSDIGLGPKFVGGEAQPLPELEPAIAAAVEAVGIEAIRMRQPEVEGVLRAHFAKAYEARVEVERRQSAGLLAAAPATDLLAEGRRKLMRALPEVQP